jgi:hypothetical protein
VVADDALSAADRAALGDFAGCIAGALSFTEYAEGLATAGLAGIELIPTHAVGNGMYSATVRAARPAGPSPADAAESRAAAAAGLAAARALPADGVLALADDSCAPGGACCG